MISRLLIKEKNPEAMAPIDPWNNLIHFASKSNQLGIWNHAIVAILLQLSAHVNDEIVLVGNDNQSSKYFFKCLFFHLSWVFSFCIFQSGAKDRLLSTWLQHLVIISQM